MAAETARQFERLEAQARVLMATFIAAGHEAVAPAMIQPAGIYLDVIGEELRARTYVFTDPEGTELCLRPDLTVPACRLHLERTGNRNVANPAARYCYNGAAFRFQPQGFDAATHPREFRQAGIESFGEADQDAADAHTLSLVLSALKAAGLRRWRLRLGDLGLFEALIARLDMPGRWRARLKHAFWRRHALRAEIARLSRRGGPAAATPAVPPELMAAITADPGQAGAHIEKHLEVIGAPQVGIRTAAEIAAVLKDACADAMAAPLDPKAASLIASYVAISGPALGTGQEIAALAQAAKVDIGEALGRYQRRLRLLTEAGVDLEGAMFSAEFGRHLHYYTGFVFEVLTPGQASAIAGGGRYDGLMRAVGATADTPAVGAAIHTERLLRATNGGNP